MNIFFRQGISYTDNYNLPLITQSKELQADWLILENNEKASLCIKMPSY